MNGASKKYHAHKIVDALPTWATQSVIKAHVDFSEDIKISQFDAILEQIKEEVYHNYGINHVNIQPEFEKCDSKHLIVHD